MVVCDGQRFYIGDVSLCYCWLLLVVVNCCLFLFVVAWLLGRLVATLVAWLLGRLVVALVGWWVVSVGGWAGWWVGWWRGLVARVGNLVGWFCLFSGLLACCFACLLVCC